jgi:hypothetical protein
MEAFAVPWARMTALVLYASAAAQSRCGEEASILYELIEPWKDQLTCADAVSYGHVTIYLGALAGVQGKHDVADEHLSVRQPFPPRERAVVVRRRLGSLESRGTDLAG